MPSVKSDVVSRPFCATTFTRKSRQNEIARHFAWRHSYLTHSHHLPHRVADIDKPLEISTPRTALQMTSLVLSSPPPPPPPPLLPHRVADIMTNPSRSQRRTSFHMMSLALSSPWPHPLPHRVADIMTNPAAHPHLTGPRLCASLCSEYFPSNEGEFYMSINYQCPCRNWTILKRSWLQLLFSPYSITP